MYNMNPFQYGQPQLYMPQYGMQTQSLTTTTSQPVQQSVNNMTSVNGVDAAKQFSLPPNSVALLMDDIEDKFYIKTTDATGRATLKIYTFKEDGKENSEPIQNNYVSRKEFDDLILKYDNYFEQIQNILNNGGKK